MRHAGWLALGAVVCALLAGALAMTTMVSAQDGVPANLSVELSKSEVSTATGDGFTFTSVITNNASTATPALIANLDFVAVDNQTYVDPEDWSSHRTLNVPPIAPGATATQTWTVSPVIAGDVAAYVAVLPAPPALAGSGPLAVSAPLSMHVAERRAINPGGVLPVVIIVPTFLALVFGGMWVGRRRAYSVRT